MTKLEYIKNELENLCDDDLMEIYNEYADKNRYERIFHVSELELVDSFDGSMLDIINRVQCDFKEFDSNDEYYQIDGNGNYISSNSAADFVDIDELAKAIENEDITTDLIDLEEYENEE